MSTGEPRIVIDSIMRKLPSRKYYRVTLLVPDDGAPIIEYRRANSSKKPKKTINFVDLLFADKKHDTSDKCAFSVFTTEKTFTFLAQDETSMNDWLSKIKECHSNLYPEFKNYDAIFEADVLEKGLGKTMNIQGSYRLALCKDSLDLIPLKSTAEHNELILIKKQQKEQQNQVALAAPTTTTITTTTTTNTNTTTANTATTPSASIRATTAATTATKTTASTAQQHQQSLVSLITTSLHNPVNHHPHHLPQHLPSHQRFNKRHALLSSKIIELVLRSIRRCGHNDSNFLIESGRQSPIGQGDLWMAFNKKSTIRQFHELLLATMKLASTQEDEFLYKAPRSRSGSSTASTMPSILPIFSTKNDNINEDSGYVPMA